MWFGRGGYIFSSKKISEKAKHLRIGPSIGGNVGETWLRRGPIINPPYYGHNYKHKYKDNLQPRCTQNKDQSNE